MTQQRSVVLKSLLTAVLVLAIACAAAFGTWWLKQPRPGHVKDEALTAGRDASSFPAALFRRGGSWAW